MLKRKIKEYSDKFTKKDMTSSQRPSRDEVQNLINESLEAEKKAREAERKSFLQQRAEVVCMNHGKHECSPN
jgi:hypothetical protein